MSLPRFQSKKIYQTACVQNPLKIRLFSVYYYLVNSLLISFQRYPTPDNH